MPVSVADRKKRVKIKCAYGFVRDVDLQTLDRNRTRGKDTKCRRCRAAAMRGPHPEHADRCAKAGNNTVRQPACPTIHPPGTAGKIEVMGLRVERDEAVFHSHDARYENDPRPYDFIRRQRLRFA